MLMAGSSTRLFLNIVSSLWCLGFFAWALADLPASTHIGALLGIALTVHSLVLTVRMLDLPTPIVTAGPNGMVFSKIVTTHDLLDWPSIRKLNVVDVHFHLLWIPWLGYLGVRTNRPGYFDGWSRLLPTTWFGIYLLPTRLLRGGGRAARQFVRIIDRLREADRHDAAHQQRAFMSDASLRWNMMRNVQFPLAKDGPNEEAMVGAVRDSLLEQAGLHRDLLPEEVRRQILESDGGKALAAKGEEWGHQLAADLLPKSDESTARPDRFDRKRMLLNGEAHRDLDGARLG